MKDLLTEEEYIELIESTVCYVGKAEDLNTNESVLRAKTLGYIKENPVDKAKREYKVFIDDYMAAMNDRELCVVLYDAIEYLFNVKMSMVDEFDQISESESNLKNYDQDAILGGISSRLEIIVDQAIQAIVSLGYQREQIIEEFKRVIEGN